jgi:hypothetical protein
LEPRSLTTTVRVTGEPPVCAVNVTTTEIRRLAELASSRVAALFGLIVMVAPEPEAETVTVP